MTQSTVLVLGGEGQVGKTLGLALSQYGQAMSLKGALLGRAQCDIVSSAAVAAALDATRPNLVINCAAMTHVDRAELDPSKAAAINCDGASNVATICSKLGLPLIHLSTDYVFGKSLGRAFVETDRVGPLNLYGRSKADGEVAIQAAHPQHVILRTSWVYSELSSNFLMMIMSRAQTATSLSITTDECACPTLANDLARGILDISRQVLSGHGEFGIYHCCGSDSVTRLGFAAAIMAARKALGAQTCELIPTSQAAFAAPARRPEDSRLDCHALEKAYNVRLPGYKSWLPELVKRLVTAENRN